MNKIKEILKTESAYRLKQVKKAVFQNLIENWEEITSLPKFLHEKLAKECSISELKTEKILTSNNEQTIKVLFKLKDGLKIESVLMKHEDSRRTVCVSSQVGCSVGCKFCATGRQGFKRNLSADEIVEQVLFFARLLKKSKEKVSNVVFMGMGEPFLNYDNVLEAIKILNDKDGFNLGARHISISTAGIIKGIEKLAAASKEASLALSGREEKLQVNLAISLHAPNNELRSEIMPVNKIYPLGKVLNAVADYLDKTKRKVMFEYLMMDGINDSEKEAQELAKLMKKPLYLVNLISYNPISHSEFKPSPGWKIKKFKEILEKAGVAVTQRYRFGREIKAACGQLAGKNNL